HHVWRHEGKEVDNIALNINGGREEGYRAWTHKLNFPQNPIGKWQIHVVTEAEQVIGILRFEVVESRGAVQTSSSVLSESPAAGAAKLEPITQEGQDSPVPDSKMNAPEAQSEELKT